MAKHIVKSYDKDMQAIKSAILTMGEQVNNMIINVMNMLDKPNIEQDFNLEIKKMDGKVNSLDFNIEKQAITTLALRQPMAIDLRILISALKIAVILERMGDLMKNTTKRLSMVKTIPDSKLYNEIKSMAKMTSNMLQAAILAFKALDKEKALKVCESDLKVDEVYVKLLDRLEVLMQKHPDDIRSLLNIMFAIRNIERFGDYSSKCAKIIYYVDSGEIAPKIKCDIEYDKAEA